MHHQALLFFLHRGGVLESEVLMFAWQILYPQSRASSPIPQFYYEQLETTFYNALCMHQ